MTAPAFDFDAALREMAKHAHRALNAATNILNVVDEHKVGGESVEDVRKRCAGIASALFTLLRGDESGRYESAPYRELHSLQTWLTCRLIGNAVGPDLQAVKGWISALSPITGQAVPSFVASAAEVDPVVKDPPPGLLMSMAIRFDHGLGCPGYYDQPFFSGGDQPTHAQRLKSTLGQMRQLWEEVVGQGFYRPEREAEYAAKAVDQGPAVPALQAQSDEAPTSREDIERAIDEAVDALKAPRRGA